MIIEYSYRYWADNGSCSENKLEEFEDESSAIKYLASISHHRSINGVTVDRVIGGIHGALERISAGVVQDVADKVKLDRIKSLRERVRLYERFFDNLEENIAINKKGLHDDQIELRKLEAGSE